MDVESFEDGYVAKILFGEGASAPVGATVAVLAKVIPTCTHAHTHTCVRVNTPI
jgi:pyruvate/2-oxoglutarate dehydrogenase complex dihydrolipoamide acyltransferase (E2) component